MNALLEQTYFRKLDRLALATKTRGASHAPGKHQGTTRGYSTEFANYRKYNPGDDVRYIDWSIYARSRKLFIREFRAESDLNVHVLLDVSKSMAFGKSDKLDYAKKIAFALCYVGLNNLDRVALATFSDRIHDVITPQRGKKHLLPFLRIIDDASLSGPSDFNRSFEDYTALAEKKKGLFFIVSDFFAPGGYRTGLELLHYNKFDVSAIQVLAEEELDPRIESGVEIRDVEDESLPHLTVGESSISRYRQNVKEHMTSLGSFCASRGSSHIQAMTSLPFEDLVKAFIRAGVWQTR